MGIRRDVRARSLRFRMASLDDNVRSDTTYSPGSDSEVEEAQTEPGAGVLPGTGGPDDSGQADAAESVGDEIHRPRDTGAH